MSSHAEVGMVWPRDGRIRITGRLHDHGLADPGSWSLLLRLRDHAAQQLRYDATLDGDGFDVAVPVDDLALDGLARATWDLHLVFDAGADEELLRVGKHLDDIRDKQKVYVFPSQTVTSDEYGTVVTPFYTVNDNLSVGCVPGEAKPLPEELLFAPRERAGR